MLKITAVITAILSVLLSCTLPASFFRDKEDVPHRYIVIIQNIDDENTIRYMKNTYGENSPDNEIMYASGVCGPLLLTDSPEVIANKTEMAFASALRNNIPVWFQIDDVNNSFGAYAGEGIVTCEKWYENPLNVEKLGFGQDAPSARYWFNWGEWKTTSAMPCLNSPSFIAYIQSQLNGGFIPVLQKYLKLLKEQNREYLLAGVCVGWETRIPDYTDIPDGTADQYGSVISPWEQHETGYRALENLGYDAERLSSEAKAKHISEKQLMFDLLCGVEHDYSEMIAKTVYDAGVEKTKIFTHFTTGSNLDTFYSGTEFNFPYIKTAVNAYSTPGFTVGINPSTEKLCRLKTKIALADPSQKYYGAVESYATELNKSKKTAENYFDRLFNSGALAVALYGFDDPETSPFFYPREADAPLNETIRGLVSGTKTRPSRSC